MIRAADLRGEAVPCGPGRSGCAGSQHGEDGQQPEHEETRPETDSRRFHAGTLVEVAASVKRNSLLATLGFAEGGGRAGMC